MQPGKGNSFKPGLPVAASRRFGLHKKSVECDNDAPTPHSFALSFGKLIAYFLLSCLNHCLAGIEEHLNTTVLGTAFLGNSDAVIVNGLSVKSTRCLRGRWRPCSISG